MSRCRRRGKTSRSMSATSDSPRCWRETRDSGSTERIRASRLVKSQQSFLLLLLLLLFIGLCGRPFVPIVFCNFCNIVDVSLVSVRISDLIAHRMTACGAYCSSLRKSCYWHGFTQNNDSLFFPSNCLFFVFCFPMGGEGGGSWLRYIRLS